MIAALLLAPLLWGGLQSGRYDVGYRVIYATDASRSWGDRGGRPIRISVWYPAKGSPQSQPMRYDDYFHFDGPPEFHDMNAALEKGDRESYIEDFTIAPANGRALFEKLIETPVAAHRDAPTAAGRFPLVLYSGGLGSRSGANVELAEFLASHGYVVATVPQLGPAPDKLELGGSPAEIDLHVRDFEFALTKLRGLPEVDATRLVVAGHSVGGIVALDLASQLPNVRAVVTFDGSYGFAGGAKRIGSLPGYDPDRVTAPLLDLRRANGVQGAKVEFTALDRLHHSDRTTVLFRRMFHGDFTEFGPMGLLLGIPLPPNNDARTRRTGYEGNQRAYRAALDFLDAKLSGESLRTRQLKGDVGTASLRHELPR